MMLYLFEFIFFSVFFLYKLYLLVANNISFLTIGGKLRKYIDSLKNITCSFNNTKILNNFNSKIIFHIPPSWYRKLIICIVVSTVVLIFKISISYNFLFSNVLFVTFFDKTIDISYILSDYYIIFKLVYYTLFFFFVFCLTYKFYSFFYLSKSKDIIRVEKNEGICVNLGKSNNELVLIKEFGLYQNILITGSIGAGKTSSAISNILDSLFKENIGGLIIDIKGNFINTVNSIAKKHKREADVVEISLYNNFVYNPLNEPDMPSAELASIIKKVLILISKNRNDSEPFWLDKSEEYIRDFITLIRIYNKGNVNFSEIHNLVIDKEYLNKKLKEIKNRVLNNEFSDEELFNIKNAILNINNDYLGLDDRTFGIIRAEITRMTSIFLSNTNFFNKFCQNSKKISFDSNKVFVVSLDLANNDKLSKILATYIKLNFQRQVLQKLSHKKAIFFLCDEYQEVCNIQDGNFFSLSREFKCINVISMQSYTSLINTLPNEYAANVIIQNFVNKIWFRNDDIYTVDKIISQLGKEKKITRSKTYTENGRNSKYCVLSNKIISYKSDFSEGYSENESLQEKYSQEYFTQNLKTFEAMCVLTDGKKIKLYEKVKMKRWGDDTYEKE